MDAWRPSATMDCLRQRARLMQTIRNFFTTRNYWEVETPAMAQFGISDVYLSNIKVQFRGQTYCLQTSPEYHMKRLLAAGSGSIFQLARVFRDDELGRWHNPEFTLLEWYRLDVDHHGLMDEMDAFLQQIFSLRQPMIRKTYQQIFQEICAFDPLDVSLETLKQSVRSFDLHGVLDAEEEDRDQYLFLLMSHVVEPTLAKEESPVAVYDFPLSQASLAKSRGNVAERFEVYYRGVELANGFHELLDGDLQRQRFEADNAKRQQLGLAPCALDENFLSALAHGLPACSGVALGVDRLAALLFAQNEIAKVMAFNIDKS